MSRATVPTSHAMSADTPAIGLIGRDREVRALAERMHAARGQGGGALLVRGDAGIGKSSLLESARAHAEAMGFEILTTTGVQSEAHLPFAGLHQLLRPILHRLDRVPDSYSRAIRGAFGLSDQSAPNPFLIALSILHLLCESEEPAPILLLVDDAHWLDTPTAGALAFVARRLESDPIMLVGAMRDGFASPFLDARIPELRIGELSDGEATSLLAVRAPGLIPELRDRIVREAAGNPLALVELSVGLGPMADRDAALPTARRPLTVRLEHAFADRLPSLTPGTRSFLHVAAVEEDGGLAPLLSAASTLAGREITLDSAAEACAAGLVEFSGHRLRFRHPLMRAAIQQAMSLGERLAAHAALAAAPDIDPDHRAWHRAVAATENNEPLAADLEASAIRAERRGAIFTAQEALERAAQLSDDGARRGRRLLHAAYLALDLGRPGDVQRLLTEINDLDLTALDRPQAAWLRELVAKGSWSGASRVDSLVEIADRMRVEGDIDRGLAALVRVGLRCWWSNPGRESYARLIAVARRFPVAGDDPRLISILALAEPVEHGAAVIERLSRRWAEPGVDPGTESYALGLAAQAVGDFAHSDVLLETHIDQCRTHGWLWLLANALMSQAWNKIHRGDWKQGGSMASEAGRLADETGQGSWARIAGLAAATIAAYRGEIAAAEALAAAGEQSLLPLCATPMQALVHIPRGAAALADGRFDEAYQHLRRIFDPADSAYHPHVRSWALVDLVEAATHSGHEDDAAVLVSELERVAARTRSPWLKAGLAFARPVLSREPDDSAFLASLGAGLGDWPFIRARLELAYGLWLRRQRRPADARTPLRAARDGFDALGAVPWGERARQELRASGEASRRRAFELSDTLSPQELQIAQLAAAGMSNKEIGRRLFLSHRTVGSHLYRIFPKLGITARSHLRAVLQENRQPSPR